jgi:hypothetical protein
MGIIGCLTNFIDVLDVPLGIMSILRQRGLDLNFMAVTTAPYLAEGAEAGGY